MSPKKLQLEVITQERKILSESVDIVMAPAHDGQIGILPGHISLLTHLQAGELYIFSGPSMTVLAVSGGLLDIHDNQVSVMAESAVRADEIDIAKVEAAKAKAEEALKERLSAAEFAVAEADLRKAVLELKVAKRRHQRVNFQE
ncbi:MAG: ATP synthase F1 subunit epsilon [Patescibacteria group bacterium]